jgi:hypothetical protein
MNQLLKIIAIIIFATLAASCNPDKSDIIVYPAPEGEALNTKFTVSVNGMDVPVYNAKIGMEDKVEREKAMDQRLESEKYYDIAGFASFDMKKGPAQITVSVEEQVVSAKILPTSFGIKSKIKG